MIIKANIPPGITSLQRQTAVTALFFSNSYLKSTVVFLSNMQRQTAVTAHLNSKQLLLFFCVLFCGICKDKLLFFVFAQRFLCQYSTAEENHAAKIQTAVSARLKSKQLLLFAFALRSVCQYSMAEENPAAKRQTSLTAYLESKQLLLLVFASQNSELHQCWFILGQRRRRWANIKPALIQRLVLAE